MYQGKIGISLGNKFDVPTRELVPLMKEIGFSAISPSMPLDLSPFDIEGISSAAKKCGLSLHFLHAPFLRAADLWQDAGEKGERGERELLLALAICEKYEIPALVAHAWIGFAPSEGPTELGFARMDRVVRRAEKYGVSLAIENTEGKNTSKPFSRAIRAKITLAFATTAATRVAITLERIFSRNTAIACLPRISTIISAQAI